MKYNSYENRESLDNDSEDFQIDVPSPIMKEEENNLLIIVSPINITKEGYNVNYSLNFYSKKNYLDISEINVIEPSGNPDFSINSYQIDSSGNITFIVENLLTGEYYINIIASIYFNDKIFDKLVYYVGEYSKNEISEEEEEKDEGIEEELNKEEINEEEIVSEKEEEKEEGIEEELNKEEINEEEIVNEKEEEKEDKEVEEEVNKEEIGEKEENQKQEEEGKLIDPTEFEEIGEKEEEEYITKGENESEDINREEEEKPEEKEEKNTIFVEKEKTKKNKTWIVGVVVGIILICLIAFILIKYRKKICSQKNDYFEVKTNALTNKQENNTQRSPEHQVETVTSPEAMINE